MSSRQLPTRFFTLSGLRAWASPVTLTLAAAIAVLVLPVLIYGPWLPLLDTVAFVGMDSYPPQLSYGPLHYSVFQFSYFGHYLLSRLMCDLHIAPRFQIPVFYLLQAGACFGVVCAILTRTVQNVWLRSIGIALGTLAFWDGVFLWGGPLAFSLGGTAVSLATFVMWREAVEPDRKSGLLIALLLGFAISCHPFTVPFALVVCGIRFVFNPRKRWQTAGLAALIVVAAYVVVRDSPPAEASSSANLRLLFGISPGEIWKRIAGLFRQDAQFVQVLFGHVPLASRVLFLVMAALHLAGFVLAPFLAFAQRFDRGVRIVGALNLCTAVLYLLSIDAPTAPIPEWPQRILTLYSPFTYLAGFVALSVLLPRAFARIRVPVAARWTMPAAILAFSVVVQGGVFTHSRSLEQNVTNVRRAVLESGVRDAYVVVSDIDYLAPFYLRCVPFMLFSDPELISRNVLVATEWHFQARHPTRLTEASFNLGRKRYQARFASADGIMTVRLVEQPMNRFPVIERTNQHRWGAPPALAFAQLQQGGELFRAGVYVHALEHYNTAIYLAPNFASAWSDGGAALVRLGRYQEAVTYFENALRLEPSLVPALTNLGAALIALGRTAEAVAPLEKALALDPQSDVAADLLARARASATP